MKYILKRHTRVFRFTSTPGIVVKFLLMSVLCRRQLEELVCGHFDTMSARIGLAGVRIAVPCLERRITSKEFKTFLDVL
jgi:hypothetical protein